MKALVLTEVGKFTYKDVPEPTPQRGEVKLRIKAVAICGSDVHGYDGFSGRRIPPVIIGHEASGEVVSVGEGVTDFKAGDGVVFNSLRYCGTCWYCQRGLQELCENGCCYGIHTKERHLDGAMCDYLCVPAYLCYHIPEGVSYESAALIEPLSIAVHAVGGVEIHTGDTAVIFGAGVIGLMLLKVLRTTGCGKLIVVELDEAKRAMAKANGADVVLDGKGDVAAQIHEVTCGRGADLAFEAVGIPITMKNAVNSLRPAGILVQVGNVAQSVDLPLQTIVMKELQIRGRCYTSVEYETSLRMVESGKISLEDCISVVAPLTDGQEWFDRLHAQEPGLVRVVLKP